MLQVAHPSMKVKGLFTQEYMSHGTLHEIFQGHFRPGLDPGQDIYPETPALHYRLSSRNRFSERGILEKNLRHR